MRRTEMLQEIRKMRVEEVIVNHYQSKGYMSFKIIGRLTSGSYKHPRSSEKSPSENCTFHSVFNELVRSGAMSTCICCMHRDLMRRFVGTWNCMAASHSLYVAGTTDNFMKRTDDKLCRNKLDFNPHTSCFGDFFQGLKR